MNDERHLLFSYFALMLRGVKGSLVDADEELAEFNHAETMVYDLGKVMRGQEWDATAFTRSRKHFRLTLLSLCSSLDCVAELTALLIPNTIPGLKLGRAEFSKIEEWLRSATPCHKYIFSPQEVKAEELRKAVGAIVESGGEEKEWLPTAKMLRNKCAHLGTEQFREIGFHDKQLVFYTFLPRKWPFLWEESFSNTSHATQRKEPNGIETIIAPLMRQDKVSYLFSLQKKITALVDAAIEILDSVYADHQDFAVDPQVVEALENSTKQYAFQSFG